MLLSSIISVQAERSSVHPQLKQQADRRAVSNYLHIYRPAEKGVRTLKKKMRSMMGPEWVTMDRIMESYHCKLMD